MMRRSGRFTAIAENGAKQTVYIFTGYVVAHPANGGPPELLHEEPEYRTASGLEVEKIGPDRYRVTSTGQVFCSVDQPS